MLGSILSFGIGLSSSPLMQMIIDRMPKLTVSNRSILLNKKIVL